MAESFIEMPTELMGDTHDIITINVASIARIGPDRGGDTVSIELTTGAKVSVARRYHQVVNQIREMGHAVARTEE